MTTLTLTTIVLIMVGFIRPRRMDVTVALGAATPTGVALVAAGFAVPTFYAVAVGVLALTLFRAGQKPERARGGPVKFSAFEISLLALFATAVIVTLISPFIFAGTSVLSSTGTFNRLEPGFVSKSNLAQMLYIMLGATVVLFILRSPNNGRNLVGIAAGIATVLSFWAWASVETGFWFPSDFFDNSPFYSRVDLLPGGEPRIRGIFSEPAALATNCLTTSAYCVARLKNGSLRTRVVSGILLAMAMTLGLLSTSTTFFVAGAILVILLLTVSAIGLARHQWRLTLLKLVAVVAAICATVWAAPKFVALINSAVEGKVGTSSYNDRTAADAYSYDLLFRTGGLGVGVGSNRPSSLPATMLSTVGLLGTALLIAIIAMAVRAAKDDPSRRPTIWALAALLAAKCVSGPDLADPSGLLWICLGVLGQTLHSNLPVSQGNLLATTRLSSKWTLEPKLRTLSPPTNER